MRGTYLVRHGVACGPLSPNTVSPWPSLVDRKGAVCGRSGMIVRQRMPRKEHRVAEMPYDSVSPGERSRPQGGSGCDPVLQRHTLSHWLVLC